MKFSYLNSIILTFISFNNPKKLILANLSKFWFIISLQKLSGIIRKVIFNKDIQMTLLSIRKSTRTFLEGIFIRRWPMKVCLLTICRSFCLKQKAFLSHAAHRSSLCLEKAVYALQTLSFFQPLYLLFV